MKTSAILAGALLALSGSLAQAGTVTYTGADLLSVATFPSAPPTLVGTSLTFASNESSFLKLLSLPVTPAADGKVRVIVNFTRPPCDDPGCAGGALDFDPNFGISDGTLVAGGLVADNFNGQGFYATYVDQGSVASRAYVESLFTEAGYPAIGESFDVVFEAEVLPGMTRTALAFLGGSGTYASGPGLTGPLAFVLIRDNDSGERYQVNSITVETTETTRPVGIDIKPGSCENPFNVNSHGVLPVAIPGTADLNVTDIDPATLTLNGVPALRWSYADQTAAGVCACARGDGLVDLLVKFDSDAVAATLAGQPDGAVVSLRLEGAFRAGGDLEGSDQVRVIRKR